MSTVLNEHSIIIPNADGQRYIDRWLQKWPKEPAGVEVDPANPDESCMFQVRVEGAGVGEASYNFPVTVPPGQRFISLADIMNQHFAQLADSFGLPAHLVDTPPRDLPIRGQHLDHVIVDEYHDHPNGGLITKADHARTLGQEALAHHGHGLNSWAIEGVNDKAADCRHCGRAATQGKRISDGAYFVKCDRCGGECYSMGSPLGALELWNNEHGNLLESLGVADMPSHQHTPEQEMARLRYLVRDLCKDNKELRAENARLKILNTQLMADGLWEDFREQRRRQRDGEPLTAAEYLERAIEKSAQ